MSDILQSLDPRVERMHIPTEGIDPLHLNELNHHETWEVFHQAKSGGRHIHVGSVHAPTAELAMIYAKEQFARRSQCVNMWVVKTLNVYATAVEDSDYFSNNSEKVYREASGYKVMQKVNAYKKRNQMQESSESTNQE